MDSKNGVQIVKGDIAPSIPPADVVDLQELGEEDRRLAELGYTQVRDR